MTKPAAPSAGDDALHRVEQAESALASLQQQLDHAHRLATLGTLAAGIAHEINNVLTPVLAYAQLARANPRDPALQAKALDRAIAGAESAARITQAVLCHARADDDAEHANISRVIDASLACLGRDPAGDGITLLITVEPDAEVAISPLALQQVLLNLILNALAAMSGRQGELRIAAERRGDGSTQITVADSGPGIPAEVAATLFEPFVTGHSRTEDGCSASGCGGTGLGLAVCRRLLEEAGGGIAVTSAPQHGATFTITLPTPSLGRTGGMDGRKVARSPLIAPGS